MPDGTIADASGNALLDTNGRPMQVSPADTQITIAGDGTLSSENGQIGKIGVVQPDDPMRLQAEGGATLAAGRRRPPLSPRPSSCRARSRNPTCSPFWN